jgi:protein-tyrosine phosphatase
MDDNRFIKLEGASNFREIGALETNNGFLKKNILFRSDDLSKLTKNDLHILEKLNLKLICDLRTPNERKSKPDRLYKNNNIKLVNIPFYQQKRDVNQLQIIWYLFTNSEKINFEKFIKDHYMNNAFVRTKEIGQIIKLLSDGNNLPALIHCAAGKDRTGLLSAIIQLLAGVERENVLDEYLSTNIFMKQKMKSAELIIRRMSLFRIPPEKIKPLLEVKQDYLDDVLNEIIIRYNTIENYLSEACGVEEETVLKFKSLILE